MDIELNPDTVRSLVQAARDFHNRDALPPFDDDDDAPSAGDDSALDDGDSGNDPLAQEFRNLVADLEPDQQQQLVALYWLGRGDFEPEQWDDAVEQATDAWNRRTADYLLGHPQIADDLEAGLSLLGYDSE